jgi:hypothetical protein
MNVNWRATGISVHCMFQYSPGTTEENHENISIDELILEYVISTRSL